MERYHEIIDVEDSLVHDWRVAQLRRLGIPGVARRGGCRSRGLAPDRQARAARLCSAARLAHSSLIAAIAAWG